MSESNQEIAAAFGGVENRPANFSPQALMQSAAKLPRTSADPFLSFRDGEWTFGASQDECEEDALWAVDPTSFGNGLLEWDDSKAGGEIYVPMGTEYSEDDVVFKFDPNGKDWGLAPQIGCELTCLTGSEKGLKVLYKTSTRGGVDALADLATKIGQNASGDDADLYVPVVKLDSSSYTHKKYGKKWIPILDVQAWDDINLSETLAELDSKKPKKAKKAKKVEASPKEAEPTEDEAPPPARRRRRR